MSQIYRLDVLVPLLVQHGLPRRQGPHLEDGQVDHRRGQQGPQEQGLPGGVRHRCHLQVLLYIAVVIKSPLSVICRKYEGKETDSDKEDRKKDEEREAKAKDAKVTEKKDDKKDDKKGDKKDDKTKGEKKGDKKNEEKKPVEKEDSTSSSSDESPKEPKKEETPKTEKKEGEENGHHDPVRFLFKIVRFVLP
jgi:hypothetical protein